MCRIFAQISVTPRDPTDYLAQSGCSLLAQSQAKKDYLQKDGWGIAALREKTWDIFKSPKPIFKEKPLFIRQAHQGAANITIAHIRAASNPMKLPLKALIAKEHNQPFGCQRVAFAHNGTLNIAAAARERLLGRYQSRPEGKNDSEIYFWILYKRYAGTKDVPKALHQTVRDIWTLWRRMPASQKKNWKLPYTGLNAAVSDGRKLYALGHSLMPAQSKALCLKDQPYNQLAFKLEDEGRRFIVGSEKFSREPGWQVLGQHRLLTAWPEKGKIKFNIQPFRWNKP